MSKVAEQHQGVQKRPLLGIAVLLAVAAFVAAVLVRLWRRWRLAEAPPERRPPPPAIPIDIEGLTEEEAQARRLEGQDNAIYFKPPRSQQDIWRENVYTIFNFSLVGLAIAQLLLGQPLGALASLGTIVLNIGINIGQELWTKRRLREVEQAARPKATVVRESKARSIDPSEIVLGDMLIAGQGDQVFVDGEIVGEGWVVVDEAMLTGESARITKHTGDTVYAGSFCVSGRAVYEAHKVGQERLIATRIGDSPASKVELTPLERIVERVLWILLGVVAVFTILLLLTYFRLDTLLPVDVKVFNDAASVIFGIAPASLYFMIILTYATGTADLAQLGALVHRARSVESLAQASVVCFAQAGILTGAHVEVEIIEPPAGREQLAESRIRQILGDYAHNTSVDNLATRAMATTFEGARRTIQEEAPFLSVYGWSAIAFDDADLRGTYVLGEPHTLEARLAADGEPVEEQAEGEPEPAAWRRAIVPLGRFFRRSESESDGEEISVQQLSEPEPEPRPKPEEPQPPETAPLAEDEPSSPNLFGRLSGQVDRALRRREAPSAEEKVPEDEPRPNLFRRLTGRASRLLRRGETTPEEERPEDATTDETAFIFAYHPELAPLHSAEGLPQLPEGLIPLCNLRYTEQVRPEAIDTIRTFSETGVNIKVFTAHSPDRPLAILRQAGLGADDEASKEAPLGVITGPQLAEMDAEQAAQAATENTVFGQVTPEQAGWVVAALREQDESVVVVGDRVKDLPAMQQANLAIARQSSSQAALSVADIVLLEDSPRVLQTVLDKGQRIVHGLLDVLKLNLTQVFCLALLIAGLRIATAGFPFQSGQVTAINTATVAIPSAALTLWAAAGVLTHVRFGRQLARFVLPAAITMTIAGLIVYGIFLDETGEVAYAQLALTYTLVAAGLLLVLFVKPPLQRWRVGSLLTGDWRFTILVLVLLVVFVVVAAIPLAQEHLKLAWLRQPDHYLVVGAAALVWAIVLRLFWLIVPLERRN